MSPHPEHEIARRITELQRRLPPGVLMRKPTSGSGRWEVSGPGWRISEESPVVFANVLEARIAEMESVEKRLWAAITGACDRVNELNRQRRFGAAAGEPGEDGEPIG